MKSRGQDKFINLPGFAARLYNNLSKTKAIEQQHREIAHDLVSRVESGRILDVGTGPGRLLLEIHHLNPNIALFGLDISEAMVQLAQKNLAGVYAELRQGNIQQTDYDDNFFDSMTCTGSFYLWDNPEACLAKVFRILKEDRPAYFFETYKDVDRAEVQAALRTNLKGERLLRRLITPIFLKRQLKMTYQTSEI